MPESPRFSIVLPCYNEAASLSQLLERYRLAKENRPAELILVNNGSTDNSAEVLADLLSRPEYAFATSLTLSQNRGYGDGIYQGLKVARGEFIGFSHADLQCDPKDLFRAFDAITLMGAESHRTLTKGARQGRFSFLTAGMALTASILLRKKFNDINAQPKVFHRNLLTLFTNPPPGFEFDLYVLYRAKTAGYRVTSIPVIYAPRMHETSRWAFSWTSRIKTISGVLVYIFKLGLGLIKP